MRRLEANIWMMPVQSLTPLVEGILQRDMKRFADMAPQQL